MPGLDRLLSYGARALFTPERGVRLSVRGNREAADLVRHAFADVAGNAELARSWAKLARAWPLGAQTELLELYPRLHMPVLLLWADQDELYPLRVAEEALGLLPNGQLRPILLSGLDYPFGYLFIDPGGPERILTGVYANDDLMDELRAYFDISDDSTAVQPRITT